MKLHSVGRPRAWKDSATNMLSQSEDAGMGNTTPALNLITKVLKAQVSSASSSCRGSTVVVAVVSEVAVSFVVLERLDVVAVLVSVFVMSSVLTASNPIISRDEAASLLRPATKISCSASSAWRAAVLAASSDELTTTASMTVLYSSAAYSTVQAMLAAAVPLLNFLVAG